MYTSEQRTLHVGRCTGGHTTPYARFYQETYSWRTGRRSDGGSSSHVIQPPPKIDSSAPLGDKLRARRRYLEEVGSNLVAQNAGSPSGGQPKRFLTHDTGHNFSSVKYVHTGNALLSKEIHKTGEHMWSRVLPFVTSYLEVPVGTTIKLAPLSRNTAQFNRADGSGLKVSIGPSSAQSAKDMTGLFSSARPDASIAGWGETIVELLSGNLPKVVTRLGRNIASGKLMQKSFKGNLKDLSDDYLNQLFGWSPIIRDLQATVEHLLQLHSFIYDQSYRRHRETPKRSTSHDGSGVAFGAPGIAPGFRSSSITYGDGGNIKQGFTFTTSYDTRLNARFTRARPTQSANSFADRGLLILQELGLGYPSLAWDLIPYSFLVDWVVSLSKGIDNYSTYSRASGSFTTDYAYSTTKVVSTYNIGAGFRRIVLTDRYGGLSTADSSWTNAQQSTITTLRTAATPFGLGITLPNLSSGQYAILVALGLARSR